MSPKESVPSAGKISGGLLGELDRYCKFRMLPLDPITGLGGAEMWPQQPIWSTPITGKVSPDWPTSDPRVGGFREFAKKYLEYPTSRVMVDAWKGIAFKELEKFNEMFDVRDIVPYRDNALILWMSSFVLTCAAVFQTEYLWPFFYYFGIGTSDFRHFRTSQDDWISFFSNNMRFYNGAFVAVEELIEMMKFDKNNYRLFLDNLIVSVLLNLVRSKQEGDPSKKVELNSVDLKDLFLPRQLVYEYGGADYCYFFANYPQYGPGTPLYNEIQRRYHSLVGSPDEIVKSARDIGLRYLDLRGKRGYKGRKGLANLKQRLIDQGKGGPESVNYYFFPDILY